MSNAVFNAIGSKDIESLEKSVDQVSVHSVDAEGVHPLTLVASLIKTSNVEGMFEDEQLYKKMAAVLIVNGASYEDLHHECGEVSNLCHYVCGYIIERSLKAGSTKECVELIEKGHLWFKDDDKAVETDFLDAVAKGDKAHIDSMFEKGLANYAYEQ